MQGTYTVTVKKSTDDAYQTGMCKFLFLAVFSFFFGGGGTKLTCIILFSNHIWPFYPILMLFSALPVVFFVFVCVCVGVCVWPLTSMVLYHITTEFEPWTLTLTTSRVKWHNFAKYLFFLENARSYLRNILVPLCWEKRCYFAFCVMVANSKNVVQTPIGCGGWWRNAV